MCPSDEAGHAVDTPPFPGGGSAPASNIPWSCPWSGWYLFEIPYVDSSGARCVVDFEGPYPKGTYRPPLPVQVMGTDGSSYFVAVPSGTSAATRNQLSAINPQGLNVVCRFFRKCTVGELVRSSAGWGKKPQYMGPEPLVEAGFHILTGLQMD